MRTPMLNRRTLLLSTVGLTLVTGGTLSSSQAQGAPIDTPVAVASTPHEDAPRALDTLDQLKKEEVQARRTAEGLAFNAKLENAPGDTKAKKEEREARRVLKAARLQYGQALARVDLTTLEVGPEEVTSLTEWLGRTYEVHGPKGLRAAAADAKVAQAVALAQENDEVVSAPTIPGVTARLKQTPKATVNPALMGKLTLPKVTLKSVECRVIPQEGGAAGDKTLGMFPTWTVTGGTFTDRGSYYSPRAKLVAGGHRIWRNSESLPAASVNGGDQGPYLGILAPDRVVTPYGDSTTALGQGTIVGNELPGKDITMECPSLATAPLGAKTVKVLS